QMTMTLDQASRTAEPRWRLPRGLLRWLARVFCGLQPSIPREVHEPLRGSEWRLDPPQTGQSWNAFTTQWNKFTQQRLQPPTQPMPRMILPRIQTLDLRPARSKAE